MKITKKVEEGRFLDETIDAYFSRVTLTEKERGLIQEIASGVQRWKGYLDAIVSRCAGKETKRELRYLLWIALYQVIFMKKAHYHVVNEVVTQARQDWGAQVANFLNAVLRRYVRERDGLLPDISSEEESLALNYSFPLWLARRWSSRFGVRRCERLFETLNQNPDFTLRIMPGSVSADRVTALLEREGIGWRKGTYLESALHVGRVAPIIRHRLFGEGRVVIQDECSQLAGLAVQPREGERILDACAGMGTKSLQVQALCPGSIVVSMDAERTKLRFQGSRRVAADALLPPFREGFFDTILVDAPCTSLGIIRKHPEIKWRRREEDVAASGNRQKALLDSLAPYLKRGGSLIYSVCSFEPEETTEVVDHMRNGGGFNLENPLPFLFNKEYFVSLPDETGLDGFFIAKLRKR